jgi:hypothetical protein
MMGRLPYLCATTAVQEFTELHFLLNLQIFPTSYSVRLHLTKNAIMSFAEKQLKSNTKLPL